tara:strand:- start:630 stop:1307 length:678 start_codon:yes stop_codon:yes gene_type:complete
LHISTGSTNDLCKEGQINREFLAIASDIQTRGRGRQGKKWSSPPGNISFSIAYLEKNIETPTSLVAGVIARLAICSALGIEDIKLKWPNDLIFKNKKIGGILVERDIQGNEIKTIVGIGINLALSEKEPWWGDLSSFNSSSARDDIINNIIKGFYDFIDGGLSNWQDLWNLSCVHLNKNILIKNNNVVINEGIFIGINNKGALLLKVNKEIKEYAFGEISIEGIY